jgi:long-subunit acyl-CoA synthetase (AMP-forming)
LAWYERIGVSICQGWGMTETNACGTTQTPYRSDKRECIGRVLHGMDIRIGEEQEILIKGNAMFLEYYKQPELNAEVFTEDGYFRTGDQGVIDKDGYYRIIGRIKDIFKTDKGKYVAPAPIEAAMAKSTLLEQICVVGSNLPQPVALVVLDESARTLDKTETEASLTELLDEINSDLENHEKMTAIIVLSEPWTVESGLITPTLKIRRQAIEKQFESVYKTKLSSKVVWI